MVLYLAYLQTHVTKAHCNLPKHKKRTPTKELAPCRADTVSGGSSLFQGKQSHQAAQSEKLEAEYAQLASEKAKFYEQYKEAKEELLKLKTAKQNVASFFREEEPAQQER